MFCSNCGNQLPDNAKFCRFCGTKLGGDQAPKAPDPAPAADTISDEVSWLDEQTAAENTSAILDDTAEEIKTVTEAAPEPAAEAAGEQIPHFNGQPYQQTYQQPYQQPQQFGGQPFQQPFGYQPVQNNYPAQTAKRNPGSPFDQTSKIFGLITLALCIFFIFSIMLRTLTTSYGSDSMISYKGKGYSTVSIFDNMSDAYNTNIFSATGKAISDIDYWYEGPLFPSMWIHIVFECFAIIFIIKALIALLGNNAESERKMWGAIKNSALFSFLGNLLMMTSFLIYTFSYRSDKHSKAWPYIPSVWGYIFLLLALISFIVASVMKNKIQAGRAPAVQPAPIPPQQFR